jgi:hypothetical protein
MNKRRESIIWISSIVFTMLIELIFLINQRISAISVSYIEFFLVFPMIFILVSMLIDIHEKRNKVTSCLRFYLPAMVFIYYLILGTINFYYYFSGEFLMVLNYIFSPNIVLIVLILLQIKFNRGVYKILFMVAKYVVPIFYGIYWYIIILALSGAQ